MSQKTCIKELLYGEEPVGEGNRKVVRIRALAKASVFFIGQLRELVTWKEESVVTLKVDK